jgi:hypothetical protein
MSEKIVKWVANDGSEFDSKREADIHDHRASSKAKLSEIIADEVIVNAIISNYEKIVAIMTPPKQGRGRPRLNPLNVKETVVAAKETTDDAGMKEESTSPKSRKDIIKNIAQSLK